MAQTLSFAHNFANNIIMIAVIAQPQNDVRLIGMMRAAKRGAARTQGI